MKPTQSLKTLAGRLGKVLLCALLFATGLVGSRIVFSLLGMPLSRMPEQADESIAGYYLLAGSIVLALGLVPIARRLRGTFRGRWLILAAFLFVGFGVSTSVESWIFSSGEGTLLMVRVLFLPCVVLAAATASLFARPGEDDPAPPAPPSFFAGRSPGQWTWRFGAALASFPAVYFVFGLLVSPLVADYYREGAGGLALPDLGVILGTQLLRSVLFLLITLPVMVFWSGTRRALILGLALAFFVFVAAYDVVLAIQVPLVLLVTHSVEIAADSLVYAFLLVTLLVQDAGGRLAESASS